MFYKNISYVIIEKKLLCHPNELNWKYIQMGVLPARNV